MTQWNLPDKIITDIILDLEDEFPDIKTNGILQNPNVRTRLLAVLEILNLRYARIQSMILDKMYWAAIAGNYGDLGPAGNRTPLGEFIDDMSNVYDKPYLDNFDEYGDLIP